MQNMSSYSYSYRKRQKLSASFYIGLWICAVLLYGLGDVVTTNLILTSGGRELNPAFGAMVNALGRDIWSSAIVKAVILGCLIAIYLFGSVRHRWAIPVLLSLVGAGLANTLRPVGCGCSSLTDFLAIQVRLKNCFPCHSTDSVFHLATLQHRITI